VEDLDAAEQKRGDLALGAAPRGAIRLQIIIAPIADDGPRDRRGRHQQQQRVHVLVGPLHGEALQRRRRAVAPHRIRIHDEERFLAEMRERRLHPAAGLEQHLFGRQDNVGAAVEMRGDHLGAVVAVDHDPADPGRLQPIERAVQQGASGQLHQRLRPVVGERAHAQAESGRQHHRPFDPRRRHGVPFAAGTVRDCAGTSRSNQARSDASAGWTRSPSSQRQTRGICCR
jgi:hypothetical protein